ncbi:hypothetical protein [Fibrobacter sp. UWH1]|uniref:hypothetical protein n=1 Tax=Fibrobacter sp. UWH1 TaxID=1964354 RepID=UPI001595F207|nr:hypothetical protein [Fibrobacter sp. UWH1]
MKKILLIITCLFLWNCGNCGHAKSYYIFVEKRSKIVKFDSTFVKVADITGGNIDLNSEGILERYFEMIQVYLDSTKYGKTLPKKVTGTFFKGQEEVVIDSANIYTRETVLGAGIFVQQKIIGDETRLKLVIYKDNEDSEPLILEFDIEQNSWKERRSSCLAEYLRL